ncbi:MAG: hypothetical protein Q4G24_01670 [Paracoccus sp. (in: a-proteobacteria)]|uniref:hypothetical protein n=1 Tax=Paracoccus sp. TaxID=267 RepID=UPI0026E07D70|nr:hypothetical protein [Paracoccus sp. (in: a-proteobacteria)]MDO5620160.1 hypothetical protein [Paracoccus sp. (in: a-proteobacteria)]
MRLLTILLTTLLMLLPPAFANPRQGGPAGESRSGADSHLIGNSLRGGSFHEVTRPGRYGLGNPPTGMGYAVVDGKLVRYDLKTMQIMSVLRQVDKVID